MNRIHQQPASNPPSQPKTKPQEIAQTEPIEVEKSKIHPLRATRPRHSLFSPLHYEPNYAYPLVVWLHGLDGDDRQLQQVMPLISMRNYVGVAPRGNRTADNLHYNWDDSPGGLASATNAVLDCIAAAKEKYNIAGHRTFIGGYQTGGTTAFRIALNHPEMFAGVLSAGGPFPQGQQPLRNLNRIRQLPMLIAHGRDSERYPIAQTCDELRLFHAGGLSLTLRQYPVADELDTQMLKDMDVWMMELVTGVREEASYDDSHRPFNELN